MELLPKLGPNISYENYQTLPLLLEKTNPPRPRPFPRAIPTQLNTMPLSQMLLLLLLEPWSQAREVLPM